MRCDPKFTRPLSLTRQLLLWWVRIRVACITGALWAKRGERGILREVRNECEARDEGRRALRTRFALRAKCRVRLAWLCRLELIGEDGKTLALDQELKLFAFGRYVTLFMVPRQEQNWNSFQAPVVQKMDGRPWKQSFSLGNYSSKNRLKRERVDSTL